MTTLGKYIEQRISLGNILTIIAILVGFISSYAVTRFKIDSLEPAVIQNRKDIDSIQLSQERIMEILKQQNVTLEKIDNRLYNLVDKK